MFCQTKSNLIIVSSPFSKKPYYTETIQLTCISYYTFTLNSRSTQSIDCVLVNKERIENVPKIRHYVVALDFQILEKKCYEEFEIKIKKF